MTARDPRNNMQSPKRLVLGLTLSSCLLGLSLVGCAPMQASSGSAAQTPAQAVSASRGIFNRWTISNFDLTHGLIPAYGQSLMSSSVIDFSNLKFGKNLIQTLSSCPYTDPLMCGPAPGEQNVVINVSGSNDYGLLEVSLMIKPQSCGTSNCETPAVRELYAYTISDGVLNLTLEQITDIYSTEPNGYASKSVRVGPTQHHLVYP